MGVSHENIVIVKKVLRNKSNGVRYVNLPYNCGIEKDDLIAISKINLSEVTIRNE